MQFVLYLSLAENNAVAHSIHSQLINELQHGLIAEFVDRRALGQFLMLEICLATAP